MPFDPSQLSGLVARWLAANATTDAGGTTPVAANYDIGVRINDSAGSYPLSSVNAPNALQYDATRHILLPTSVAIQFGQPWYSSTCPFDRANGSAFFLVDIQSRNLGGLRGFFDVGDNEYALTGTGNAGGYPSAAIGHLAIQSGQYPGYAYGSTPIPTGLALVGYTGSGAVTRFIVNGHTDLLGGSQSSAPSTLFSVLGLLNVGNSGLCARFREGFVLDHPASDAELALIQTYAQSQGCIFDAPSIVVYDGDSISSGAPDTLAYGWQDAMNLGPLALEYNNSKGGQSLNVLLANAPTWTDVLVGGGKNNVAVVFAATNDIDQLSRTGAQVFADTQSYGAGRKAATFKVIVVGMLPRGGIGSSDETQRAILRASMLADFTASTTAPLVYGPRGGVTYADYYVDLGGDSVMGQPGQNGDTTYYVDGVHPTQTGYARLATLIKPALALAGVAATVSTAWPSYLDNALCGGFSCMGL